MHSIEQQVPLVFVFFNHCVLLSVCSAGLQSVLHRPKGPSRFLDEGLHGQGFKMLGFLVTIRASSPS